MNRQQVETISRDNARKIIRGTDKLKSFGHSGKVFLPRLRKMMHYRSHLEMRILQAIDSIPEVVELDGESIMIPYWWYGAVLNYVPDLLLKMLNGKVWIIEIKPLSQVNEEKNKTKFAAAREFCRTHGNHLRFGVLTGTDGIQSFLATHDGAGMLEEKIRERKAVSDAR